MELYFQVMLNRFAYLLILVGALNWGLIGLFRYNLINSLVTKVSPISKSNRLVYILIGISAAVKLLNRDYYLPFLGKAVFPCDSLKLKTPKNPEIATKIKTNANSNVIYWASEGTNDIIVKSPLKAYDKYSNAGVALSDKDGIAILKLRTPTSYRLPIGPTLKPHVHYRVCLGNGMLSSIKTVFLKES